MEYHLSDVFSTADGNARRNYYTIWGIPIAQFDGERDSVVDAWPGVIDVYDSVYRSEMTYPSACTLNISVDYNPNTRKLWVKASVTAIDTFSNARLRYAIAESHIYRHWQWLDSLHHVVRKMLPNYNGIAFDIDPEESFVDSQSYTLDTAWNDKNCYVVVFVQRDDSLKPVLRSAQGGLFPWVFGDANEDGIVDVADVIYLINYMFVGGPAPSPLASGDPNGDCIVNVADIIYLINYLFVGGPLPLKGCA